MESLAAKSHYPSFVPGRAARRQVALGLAGALWEHSAMDEAQPTVMKIVPA
jgi:hypothetical protein